MTNKGSLVSLVSDDLRRAVQSGIYQAGHRLPTEVELAAMYKVSRPTVRAALRELEARGILRTRHGVGTFVSERPAIRAGLEKLDSITESIREMGRDPGMEYKSRVIRPLMPDEAKKLDLPTNSEALELRRSILADGEIVAYSYDLMPVGVFPKDMDPEELQGSIFAFLRNRLNIAPHHGVAEVHAVSSDHVGWEPEPGQETLYLLLDQLHFDFKHRPILYSRTYFIQGKYSFTILRTP